MVPDCLLDEDAEIKIESVTWAGSNLILNLKVLSDDSWWLLSCQGVSDWRIQDKVVQGLSLRDDDPVLWKSQFAIYTAYFNGKPADPYRAACGVLSALPRRSGVLDWEPNRLAHLLASGNGCFGPLPVPAIRVCQPILELHDVDLYHLGVDESETGAVSSVLYLGQNSYVIAEQFNTHHIGNG